MAQSGKKKDPTRPVKIVIIVCVLFMIGMLLYKALSSKHDFEAEQAAAVAAGKPIPTDAPPPPPPGQAGGYDDAE